MMFDYMEQIRIVSYRITFGDKSRGKRGSNSGIRIVKYTILIA